MEDYGTRCVGISNNNQQFENSSDDCSNLENLPTYVITDCRQKWVLRGTGTFIGTQPLPLTMTMKKQLHVGIPSQGGAAMLLSRVVLVLIRASPILNPSD